MWNLTYGANYETEITHIHREQTCGSQRGKRVEYIRIWGLAGTNYCI